MVPARALGSLTVAINFDDATLGLIRHASLLAKRLDLRLHFVHAVEPVFSYATSSPYPVYLEEYSSAIEDAMTEKVRAAEERLKGVVETAHSPHPVTAKALPTPFVTEAVLAEAAAEGSTLIICGVTPGKKGGIGGFSTALSLMTHSNIPVLVFRSDVKVDWSEATLRLLVADDCREAGMKALRSAYRIARKAENAVIDHIHAVNISSEDVKVFSRATLAKSGSAIADQLTGETLLQALKKEVETLLDKRAAEASGGNVPAGISHQSHFISSEVTDAVAKEAERLNTHVVVFGRHQTVHRRPFTIGAVPFRTMLSLDRPVLMTP